MDKSLEKEAILFVDDEDDILGIAQEYFQNQGYRPFIAKDGFEALKIFDNIKVDCCFTDINMPNMNGLELAENIRKRDNTVPVIIMTADPSIDNIIRTLKNGVVDYLIKPVNLIDMELCVQRVLRERQFFVENILLKKEIESKEKIERLNKELLYKVEELRILNKILTNFAMISSTTDVFKQVTDMSVDIVNCNEAIFYIISEDSNKLFQVALSQTGENKSLEDNKKDSIERVIMESVSDGIPFLIAENNGLQGIPLEIKSFIMIPLKIRNKIFGILTASNKQGNVAFTEKDLYYLSFMAQNAAHAIENHALYENIYENLFATLYAFVKAIEARDIYTQQHSERVTNIAITLAKALNCSLEDIDILNSAGRLHDIGKIGIRDNILLKPGSLTQDEFEKIKEHPVIGENIVGNLGLWDREKKIIRCHHERFDGKGYPDKLKGDEIPFLSRILSVADVYDAIASDRAYRKRMEESQILKIIAEGKGTQFDPIVVDIFFELYKNGQILKPYSF